MGDEAESSSRGRLLSAAHFFILLQPQQGEKKTQSDGLWESNTLETRVVSFHRNAACHFKELKMLKPAMK